MEKQHWIMRLTKIDFKNENSVGFENYNQAVIKS